MQKLVLHISSKINKLFTRSKNYDVYNIFIYVKPQVFVTMVDLIPRNMIAWYGFTKRKFNLSDFHIISYNMSLLNIVL